MSPSHFVANSVKIASFWDSAMSGVDKDRLLTALAGAGLGAGIGGATGWAARGADGIVPGAGIGGVGGAVLGSMWKDRPAADVASQLSSAEDASGTSDYDIPMSERVRILSNTPYGYGMQGLAGLTAAGMANTGLNAARVPAGYRWPLAGAAGVAGAKLILPAMGAAASALTPLMPHLLQNLDER